jgi:hypothetical protein
MVRQVFLKKEYATYFYRSLTNSSDVASTNIDLFKSLPDIKCVDFLSSFSRLLIFQYSILLTKGLILTPSDIETEGNLFLKRF